MILALNNSSSNGFIQFLTVFVIFIIVVVICAFTTKFVAGYQKNKMMSGNIQVLETFKIAPNKYIQIVKIGDKYFALGIGKDSVSNLGELNEDSLDFSADDNSKGTDFQCILENAKKFTFKK